MHKPFYTFPHAVAYSEILHDLMLTGPLNEMTEQCSLLPTYREHPEEPCAEIIETVRDEVRAVVANS
ncbi:hypothetical protein KKB40_06045 [Patescibacteria group bacterium]|nr:hypothetical protein [Patescibacteria group bacterium]